MRLINIVVMLLVISLFVDAKWHDIRVLKYTKTPKKFYTQKWYRVCRDLFPFDL